jgi:hypothetical protein
MKLRHVFAGSLLIAAVAFMSAPGSADPVKATVYVPAVIEDIPAPGELVIGDEPAVCQSGSCKSSSDGLLRRKPVRKLLGKLRCK